MPYSEKYLQQIADLTEWFKGRLRSLPPLIVTDEDYRRGTDSLEEPYQGLVAEAFDFWLASRHYELSYNQMNIAFWQADRDNRERI